MKRECAILISLTLLAGLLAGCAAPWAGTPLPTWVPPTQTPWIVVVTATPDANSPTQTPRVIVVTADLGKPAPAGPTATSEATATLKPSATRAKPTATRAATQPPAATATGQAGQATQAPTSAVPPTATAAPPTAGPTAAATATRPAASPTPGSPQKYPAPALLEPTNEQRFAVADSVVFEWLPVGSLAGDEFYRIEIERPAADSLPWYGSSFDTQESTFLWTGFDKGPFHPPEGMAAATVYWWIRVVRQTGVDASGNRMTVDVSAPSEKRSLVLEAKP